MTLNKKQKLYLFSAILSKEDQIKLFETTDLKWLCSQKIAIKNEDAHGWRELWCDGQLITSLNFPQNPGWDYDLEHIDEVEQCQWCEDWFEHDEMIHRKKGFTRLCRTCNSYLISRTGEV